MRIINSVLIRLFIIGGSPLSNDVWAGDLAQNSAGKWIFTWESMASRDNVPFSPRAGLGKGCGSTFGMPVRISSRWCSKQRKLGTPSMASAVTVYERSHEYTCLCDTIIVRSSMASFTHSPLSSVIQRQMNLLNVCRRSEKNGVLFSSTVSISNAGIGRCVDMKSIIYRTRLLFFVPPSPSPSSPKSLQPPL